MNIPITPSGPPSNGDTRIVSLSGNVISDPINFPLAIDPSIILGPELQLNDLLPGLVNHEPTALLLDINNIYKRGVANNLRIDYGRLKSIFESRCDLRSCIAFSALDPNNRADYDWANYMVEQGYTLYTKDLKRYTDHEGKTVTKGNMDVEMTLYATKKLSTAFGHIIIGTCDGDFIPLVEDLKEGDFRKVSVLGMRNPNGTGMSETLVEVADNFYDMTRFADHIRYRGQTGE